MEKFRRKSIEIGKQWVKNKFTAWKILNSRCVLKYETIKVIMINLGWNTFFIHSPFMTKAHIRSQWQKLCNATLPSSNPSRHFSSYLGREAKPYAMVLGCPSASSLTPPISFWGAQLQPRKPTHCSSHEPLPHIRAFALAVFSAQNARLPDTGVARAP